MKIKKWWLIGIGFFVILLLAIGFIFRKPISKKMPQVFNYQEQKKIAPLPWNPLSKGNQAMINYLKKVRNVTNVPGNRFANNVKADYLLNKEIPKDAKNCFQYYYELIYELGNAGRIQLAVDKVSEFEKNKVFKKLDNQNRAIWYAAAGTVWMRYGEVFNCIKNHNAESCIWPLSEKAQHTDLNGARNSIAYFEKALTLNPDDLASLWLMNIAYMQLGEYPDKVPAQWLIPPSSIASEKKMPPFKNIASDLGIDYPNMSGGLIYDDFNGDGLLDIFTGGWGLTEHCYYLINNGDGSFTDLTRDAGLSEYPGGLFMIQTDYNNDGLLDVYILRGAWHEQYGIFPNSLLRNNGNNIFTDVTYEVGLFSCHPTQTAVWADFNNDGWLDVFIGNEAAKSQGDNYNYSELFINDHGKFTEIAHEANIDINAFVKGVAAGDYDNDGDPDIYVSVNGEANFLFNNNTEKGSMDIKFSDASQEAGISGPYRSFPCWFFDFNNDGWLDIINFSYSANSADNDIAAEYLKKPRTDDYTALYLNNGNGTFTDIHKEAGLDRAFLVMGANFGDIDNDGWLDFYAGTGKPSLTSIIPNRFFWNDNGKNFKEATSDMHVGHLQKGHAITFSDLNNDGYVELGAQMGGAYEGDGFNDCLYENPASFENNWIAINLKGVESNSFGVGARITLDVTENGISKKIYRVVGLGSSFGVNSMRQTIGIGKAVLIKKLTIEWPASNKVSTFNQVTCNQFIEVKEGDSKYQVLNLKPFKFNISDSGHMHHQMPFEGL